MNTIDFDKFEKDLLEGNKDEVKNTLLGFLNEPVSGEDRANILLNTALIYASVKNMINGEYLELLRDTVASLKEIDKSEREAGDTIDLEDVRKKIQEA